MDNVLHKKYIHLIENRIVTSKTKIIIIHKTQE